MSRKGHSRRSKIPMAIRNGEGSAVLLGSTSSNGAGSPSPAKPMVEGKSSPGPVTKRPQAPPLSFPSPPVELAKAVPFTEPRSVPAEASKREDLPQADSRGNSAKGNEVKHEEATYSGIDRDDISVPPIGLDGGFFDEPVSPESSLEIDIVAPDLRAAMKLTPLAARRRAHLARYVTAAVGLATALCAVALVKITVAGGQPGSRPHSSSTQAAAAPPPAGLDQSAALERGPSPPALINAAPGDHGATAGDTPVLDPKGAPAPGAVPAPSAPTTGQPSESPAPADAQRVHPTADETVANPSEVAATTSDTAPIDPKAIAKEAAGQKAKSRGALEWGKVVDAIAAGERSVELDPTDAEAWLILGAAYQQKGDAKNAIRSFRSCVDQGKRGPKYDCAAMLR